MVFIVFLPKRIGTATHGGSMKKFTLSSMMALSLAVLMACAPQNQNSLETQGNQDSPAIVGGQMVVPGSQLSKQVFMIYMKSFKGGSICTATMITPTVGLTAAHCVDALIGAYAIYSIDASKALKGTGGSREALLKNPLIRQITSIRVHPQWNGSINGENNADVAVFKIAGSLPPGFEVTRLFEGTLNKGSRIIASGYGITSSLIGQGSGLLRETIATVDDPGLTESEFSIDQKNFQGSCSGDSGGPTFVTSPFGRLEQVGIVSYGDRNCEVRGVYTYPRYHMNWIANAILSLR